MSTILPCRAYHNASDLPPAFWDTLNKDEAAANIILSFAKKALNYPHEVGDEQLWIIAYDAMGKVVEFILSCTKGPVGNYPIFVFTPKSSAQLAQDENDGKDIANSLSQLVHCLLKEVPPQRVFSVFSIAYVAEKFAQKFKEQVLQEDGIQPFDDPYYDATFSFCTAETLEKAPTLPPMPGSEDTIISLRLADMSHLEGVRALCKAFSQTSPPYELDDAGAEKEAMEMITHKQVWVHLIKEGEQEWEIACLIATTRESENVTAVTKVFTAERWRRRGCAARLLYRVCQDILQKKKRIVLYVGNGDDLAPARKAYHKLGFRGLGPQKEKVEGVERWLEIGFSGTSLGYW